MIKRVSRREAFCRRALAVAIAASLQCASASDEPTRPAASVIVENCDDAGPGSLRAVLASAVNGDIVDMRALECSFITLHSGELTTTAPTLQIYGAGQTISAGGRSRVISHDADGTLVLSHLTISSGTVHGTDAAVSYGGCIRSAGDVWLQYATVRDCTITPGGEVADGVAEGGAVFARGSVRVEQSHVLDSSVAPSTGAYAIAIGGGIAAGGGLYLEESTISGNAVVSGDPYCNCAGGGIFARYLVASDSSITNNMAAYAGGAIFGHFMTVSRIINSTVSGNSSIGIGSQDAVLEVWNSTIARNTGGGVRMAGNTAYLGVRSSIVASNTNAPEDWDIFIGGPANSTITGSHDIIGRSNLPVPGDTIASDPMLGVLADNGGLTQTISLLAGSPAIDAGDNWTALEYDQRGPGHARIAGAACDIGAFEAVVTLPDVIFADGFD
ncbi:MAG: right-handed parallel beta-helix repeat-containing protein [Rhodanobacteraceae bacterium]